MVVTRKIDRGGLLYLSLGYFLIALGISPLTTTMFPQIGNLIEPFLFIGVILVNKHNCSKVPFKDTFLDKKCLFLIIVLFIFSLIGLLTSNNSTNNECQKLVYADFRSCFLFGYSVLLFNNRKWSIREKIVFLKRIIWIIIIMGFVATYDNVQANIAGVSSVERLLGIPVHYLVIQTYLYCREQKYIFCILLLALGAYYAVFSFARINIFFFIVQLLMLLYSLVLSKGKSLWQSLLKKLTIVFVITSLIYIIPKAYDFYSSSETGKAQINRMTDENEGERKSSLIVPFTDIDFYIYPEGLGWRNHIEKISRHYNYKILSTQDSCWLYLFYHFGFIVGLIINIMIFRYIIYNYKYYLSHISTNTILLGFLLLAFLMGYFTQGIYFTVPQNAVAGGIMLFLISKQNYNDKY